MDDDLTELALLTCPTFSMVMTELHQTFKEKNLGALFDNDCSSTSSGYGSVSTERTHSLPEFCSGTRTMSPKPRYSVDFIMGPICEDTIQNALRNLKPVPHPKDFTAESCLPLLPTPVSSSRSSPRTSTSSTTIKDLESPRAIGNRHLEDVKELMCSVEEYLESVDCIDATKEVRKCKFQDTPTPCPENIYGWQTGSYLNGGLRRHTNCIELDTDMTDRFTVELKPKKKKRGLFSRLRFWKKQAKSNQDVRGIDSAVRYTDKKSSSDWRLFCCF